MSTSTGPPPPKKKPTTTTRPMSAGRVRPPTPTAQRRAKLYNCATDDPVLRQKPRSPFQDPVPDDDDDDAPAPRLNLTDAPTHRRRLKHDRASDARFYAGSPTIPPGSWTGAVARYGGSGAHAIGRRCAEKGTGVVASPGREHQVSRCIVARARNVNIRPKMRRGPRLRTTRTRSSQVARTAFDAASFSMLADEWAPPMRNEPIDYTAGPATPFSSRCWPAETKFPNGAERCSSEKARFAARDPSVETTHGGCGDAAAARRGDFPAEHAYSFGGRDVGLRYRPRPSTPHKRPPSRTSRGASARSSAARP